MVEHVYLKWEKTCVLGFYIETFIVGDGSRAFDIVPRKHMAWDASGE